MKKKKIDIVAGARPNFIKIAAFFKIAKEFPNLQLRFIHTGQHYDLEMSGIFLKQLGIPSPVCHLHVGSGTHGQQTAEILKKYEERIILHRPDICLVVGDVNSTIGCALASVKQNIPVAHVESGLRSFDRTMPEEINRILTDAISNWHFVTESAGVKNLKKEGHSSSIHLVGNVMIDTLFRMKGKAEELKVRNKYNLKLQDYAYVTLHRPSNVDNVQTLKKILEQIIWVSEKLPVIFPAHPRTVERIVKTPFLQKCVHVASHLIVTKPLGYLESLSLMMDAAVVITDSGGIQEETTALNIPCLTLRENTERPITLTQGTNTLIKDNWKLFRRMIKKIKDQDFPTRATRIPLWDGQAAKRILKILIE